MSFKRRIDNLEKNFYLTLDAYKNAYIQRERDNTSENINLFGGAERRLNTVFSSLIQLQADIQSTIKTNAIDISQGNTQITTAKKSWTDSKRELKNEYATNLAANPLKRDTYKEKNSTTLTNLFYILGLIAIMVLIIKQFKTNSTPGNNAIPVARAVPVRI
jgi:hypothetical protein